MFMAESHVCNRSQVTRVAEVVHFKALMLLLHQQRGPEALAQFRDHVATYGPLPGELSTHCLAYCSSLRCG